MKISLKFDLNLFDWTKMENIFLISHTAHKDAKQIKVCEIKFSTFCLNLSDFDALVITSKNSINALKFNQIKPQNLEVFSIAESSAKSAKEFGFNQIYTAKNSHGNEFANEVAPLLKGKKTLFLRAKNVISKVGEILAQNGINLTQVIAYENKILSLSHEEISAKIPPKNSILIFTSPSNVQGFMRNFSIDESYKLIAIGKATAKELENCENLLISKTQDIDECIKLAHNILNKIYKS